MASPAARSTSGTPANVASQASSSSTTSKAASAPPAGPRAASLKAASDPILRNALRYTVSAREYALLHRYLLSRSRVLKRRLPSVETVQRIIDGPPRHVDRPSALPGRAEPGKPKRLGADRDGASGLEVKRDTAEPVGRLAPGTNAGPGGAPDDYNARAVRHALRVFVATGVLMKSWSFVSARLASRKSKSPSSAEQKQPVHKSPAFRLSLSLSTILLLYRLLLRFFTRLRLHLLDPSAAPFRQRNPRTASTLTSPYAPAVGASLAGLALGIYPAQQLRVSVAIYAIFRALEFSWNSLEDSGTIWGWEKTSAGKVLRPKARPWWWGSWMLQPFAFGQLLHAAVFDRDCFPVTYGDFIFKRSGTYLPPRPEGYPAGLKWPGPYEIMDNVAQMARLYWPPFVSPTLFPDKVDTLPASLSAIAPLTSGAHPLITSLSCAVLHPADPSCTRTFVTFWLRSFGPMARLFLVIYSVLMLPRLGSLYHFPVSTLHKLFSRALGMATFLTGAMSTAWASVCFFQAWFPRSFLPTQRFFLGGFLAGFWAWVERRRGRGIFLYSARLSVDSLWKVGVKRRWLRAMKGGDVWVFVAALLLTGVVYERDARAVREQTWRKGISWVRGEDWRDWAIESEDEEDGEDLDAGASAQVADSY